MSVRGPKTIMLMVDNEFGVLTRITALLRREGFNIASLAVSVTTKPEISRMIISVECIDTAMPKIIERLNKLSCVETATVISGDFHLGEELDIVFSKLSENEKGGF